MSNFNKNVQAVMGSIMKIVTFSGEFSYDFRNLDRVPADIPCVFVRII